MATGGFVYHVNFHQVKNSQGYGEIQSAFVFTTSVATKADLVTILTANSHAAPGATIGVQTFSIVANAVES